MTSALEVEQATMEANLKTWQEELKLLAGQMNEDENPNDEVDMDGLRFTDNKITVADWETFHKMSPGAIALSLTECDLESIEVPEKELQLKVLDVSRNKLSNFDFLKKCPHLVSLVISGNQTTLEKLPLKDLAELRLLEAMTSSDEPEMVFDEECMEFENPDALRVKIFEACPQLDKFNSKDKNGDMEEEDLLEIMARQYQFHQDALEELDSDEDDLEDDEEKEEEKDEDDDQPPAKKAKTDEKEE